MQEELRLSHAPPGLCGNEVTMVHGASCCHLWIQ